jgi:hypothetical protein
MLPVAALAATLWGCHDAARHSREGALRVSENGHYLMTRDGRPFFWLGDTGWLLFSKLKQRQVERYLDDRKKKGFNVIQVMVLHGLNDTDAYGDSALVAGDVAVPRVTPCDDTAVAGAYDFWDNVDFVIDQAAVRGIYVAMVPVWGANVRAGLVSRDQAGKYAAFLARRYRDKPNVIWMNGGDVKGSDSTAIWNIIGDTLHTEDRNHLVTFHPFGRTGSFDWFDQSPWLDFNMFQSGHRRDDQDTTGRAFGENNWKYVREALAETPVKPVLDGEPSYEGIPQGLHDTTQPRWTADQVRRYAYWSVFAGACGFTYGDNAVMQMHRPGDGPGAYGVRQYWFQGLDAPGAGQMQYLKALVLSRPYFERRGDTVLVANQGTGNDYLAATRGQDYAWIYTWNGRPIDIYMNKLPGGSTKASWYNPRNGKHRSDGVFANQGIMRFVPPGEEADGNDWVLMLDGVPHE